MFFLFFCFSFEAQQQTWPDKPLAPQVEVIGRGPAESDMYFDGQNCGAQSFDILVQFQSFLNRIFWWVRIKIDGQKKIQTLNSKKKGVGGAGRSNLKIIKRNFKIPCKRYQIQKKSTLPIPHFITWILVRNAKHNQYWKTNDVKKNVKFIWIKN
jgi:hypothetical protein